MGSQVFGWYNLPHNRAYYLDSNGNAKLNLLAEECTGVADPQVAFPGYTTINLMFNGNLDGAAWGGWQTLTRDGQRKTYGMTWMPPWSYENVGILGHEMGRSYGCMAMHTIAAHKDKLGWIPASQKYTATSASDQHITIERRGITADGNYLMAKIPIDGSSTRFYTLEARRFGGLRRTHQRRGHRHPRGRYDHRHRSAEDRQGRGPRQRRRPNDAGAMWLPGETFTDSANEIKVKVTGATASGFDVTINPSGSGGGDPAAPRLTSSVPPPSGTMARSASITAEISESHDPTTLKTLDGRYSNVELFKFNKENNRWQNNRWQYVGDTRVSCDRACDTITLDPYPGGTSRLLSAGRYKVMAWRYSSGLKDLSGTPLSGRGDYLVSKSGDFVCWWFRVGS